MKTLHKYIYTTLVTYIALVILFLLGVQIFIEFMHEFPALGVGDYNLSKVALYVLLMLPYDIYQFFPIACLLGLLLAFGLLAMHSELIVMRVSGMSLFEITKLIIVLGMVLMVVMIFLGEVLSPLAQSRAARIKAAAMSQGQVLLTRQGVWLSHQEGITHIKTMINDYEWLGVTNYRFDEQQGLSETSYAASGIYKDGKWLLQNGVRSNFTNTHIDSSNFEQQELIVQLDPKLIGIAHLDTDQKSLPELYAYIQYRVQSGYDASYYTFVFWQRIFAPFAVCIMLLFVIPFIFGALHNAHLGLKILLGVIMGFGFHLLYEFAGSISVVYHISPFWAAVLPLLMLAFLVNMLILRVR